MADEDQTQDAAAAVTNGAAEQAKPPQANILSQYIRDMSFENIAVQKGIKMEGQPDISVQVGLDAKKREPEGQFEIAVKLNVNAKTKGSEDMIFALELDYAGLFQIANVPEAQLHAFLLIECPRLLFPFLRRIVSDVTRDGGFPPLNLENIDWVMLYRNEIVRRQQQQAASGQPAGTA